MIYDEFGTIQESKAPVRLVFADCFGKELPSDLDFPSAKRIFEDLIDAETLLPGMIIPVKVKKDLTLIIGLWKFRPRDVPRDEWIDLLISQCMEHCAIYGHQSMAITVPDSVQVYSQFEDYFAERKDFLLEAWSPLPLPE